jgi:hypothetical protein
MSTQKEKSLLPLNKILILSLLSLLVNLTSGTLAPNPYACPKSCTCNYTENRLKCSSLDGLIASLNSEFKQYSSLQPVEALDLSNNQLAKVTNQLELLENLHELNLSYNSLTHVSKWTFKYLKKLDLSNNHITSAKLAKLPTNIQYLNLSNNDITYLPLSMMKLKKLRSIELDGNPINCTCDTLHVRNWLTSRHVWSDQHIKCMAPMSVKGQPWLQAKQNDICHQEMQAQWNSNGGKYDWDNYDDENELLLSDDPFDHDTYNDDDASGDDADVDDHHHDDAGIEDEHFMRFESTENPVPYGETNDTDDGSGDDNFDSISHVDLSDSSSTTIAPLPSATEDEDDYDEEDESSGLSPIIPGIGDETEDEEEAENTTNNDITEAPEENPISAPTVDSEESEEDDSSVPPAPTLGIFEDSSSTEASVVFKQGIAVSEKADEDSEIVGATSGEVLLESKIGGDSVKTAEQDDSGTFILLGIIGIALLILVVFVAMKNRKSRSRNRREKQDVESAPATELIDMKPAERNGNGHPDGLEKPINGDSKTPLYTFQPPPSITVDEPIKEKPASDTKKSDPNLYDKEPTSNGTSNIEPVHQSPPSNGSVPLSDDDEYHPALDHPVESLAPSPEAPKRYSPIYSPASPKSDRYSPVYEPETGRVKIKLTETPKPKTPVVVTRSRSKAGDYITTHSPNQRSN